MPARQRPLIRLRLSKEGKPAPSSSLLWTGHKVNHQFCSQKFKWSHNNEFWNHFPPVKKSKLTLREKSTRRCPGSAFWREHCTPSRVGWGPAKARLVCYWKSKAPVPFGSCVQNQLCIWGLQAARQPPAQKVLQPPTQPPPLPSPRSTNPLHRQDSGALFWVRDDSVSLSFFLSKGILKCEPNRRAAA